MWISEFSSYKKFLRELIKTFPKNGRGKAAALAKHLNTSPIVISEILNRDRELTLDQAIKTAGFFGLDEQASEYFVQMVGRARADSKELKSYFDGKMARIREDANKIKANVVGKELLDESEKGVFYSNWYYAAISCLVSIKGYQNVDAIAAYFNQIPKAKIAECISFLIAAGVLIDEAGLIKSGKTSSHVAEPSPYLNNHRRNWHIKAIEAFSEHNPESIHFSGPVSISHHDAQTVRKELLKLIKEFSKLVAPSPEERLMCLNIDWFKY